MASNNEFAGNGFIRNATQPALHAALRVASLSSPVMNMTGSGTCNMASSRHNSIPDLPLKWMSKIRHIPSLTLAFCSKSSAEKKPGSESRKP
jgi:hypothetical protein